MNIKNRLSEMGMSTDVWKFFLISFTLEMIKHTREGELIQLDRILERDEKKDIKKFVKDNLPLNDVEEVSDRDMEISEEEPNYFLEPEMKPLILPAPAMPQISLSQDVSQNNVIDLGLLNPLVSDAGVNRIECGGSGRNVLVFGNMGMRKTDIVLDEDEIEKIIKSFSIAARIPLLIGTSRIVYKGLQLMATITNDMDSKFAIDKLYGR